MDVKGAALPGEGGKQPSCKALEEFECHKNWRAPQPVEHEVLSYRIHRYTEEPRRATRTHGTTAELHRHRGGIPPGWRTLPRHSGRPGAPFRQVLEVTGSQTFFQPPPVAGQAALVNLSGIYYSGLLRTQRCTWANLYAEATFLPADKRKRLTRP
jgi:hypothetical protein